MTRRVGSAKAAPKAAAVPQPTIQEQSIAGAISTGTHGTGITIGNLVTQIAAITLVTGIEGAEPLVLTPKDGADGDQFRAARVSLGALGVITSLTVSCVQNYNLRRGYYLCRFTDVVNKMNNMDIFLRNTRVRFWVLVPSFDRNYNVLVTTMNPPEETDSIPDTSTPADFTGPLPMGIEDLLTILKALLGLPAEGCVPLGSSVENYASVLTLPVELIPWPHRECEYAVPIENAQEALLAFKEVLDGGFFPLKLPLEVRFVANDDSLLSPARKHPEYPKSDGVVYIGAMTHDNALEVFQRFEPLMKDFGGRPHWGKHFTLTRKEIRDMYPDSFDAFNKIRRELDPKGLFENSLIRRLFAD
jgi:L-gulono-1,4-lactone dehydrogenase